MCGIVVIDDEETFRRSVEHSLQLHGFEVFAFGDTESATTRIAAVAPFEGDLFGRTAGVYTGAQIQLIGIDSPAAGPSAYR
jgi:CheY-like chemotaxis protein